MINRVLNGLSVLAIVAVSAIAQTTTDTTGAVATQQVQQTTPTAPTQSTPPTTSVELGQLQVQFQRALDDNKKRIDDLQRDIQRLKSNKPPSDTALIEQLKQRIDLLEELNKQRQQNARKLDQIRFETGKGILNVLVEKSATLQVASGLGTALSGYQSTLNPMSDATFAAGVTKLTGTLRDGNDTVMNAANSTGLLANPYVSLVMTVVSVFASRNRPAEKVTQLRDVVCVADYSSRTINDFQFIDNSIKNLDERVRAFNSITRNDRFKNYAAAVAYDGTWDKYRDEKKASGDDPVTKLTATFFAGLPVQVAPADPLPDGLGRMRYQVESVKAYVAEYEALLHQIDDFYNSFAAIVEKDASLSSPAMCSANPSILRAQTDLKALLPKVNRAKDDFGSAYLTSIPPESRKVLFSTE